MIRGHQFVKSLLLTLALMHWAGRRYPLDLDMWSWGPV